MVLLSWSLIRKLFYVFPPILPSSGKSGGSGSKSGKFREPGSGSKKAGGSGSGSGSGIAGGSGSRSEAEKSEGLTVDLEVGVEVE